MFNFFKKSNKSKDIAKDRLKLIIVHDRVSTEPDLLESLKDEIIEVISRRLTINKSDIDIKITNKVVDDTNKEMPVLEANIPILNIKGK